MSISFIENTLSFRKLWLLLGFITVLSFNGSAQTYTLTADDITVDENGVITSCKNVYLYAGKYIKIPDFIEGKEILGIAAEVFRGKRISGVELPLYLENIGDRAFYTSIYLHVSKRPELILPPNLKYIGKYAFSGNPFSGNLIIPASVTYIGEGAFLDSGFKGRLEILSTSLTTIPNRAFASTSVGFAGNYTHFMGSLDIPKSVTRIENEAFLLQGFTGEIILPPNIEYIGDEAFRGVNFSGQLRIPSTLKHIGSQAFKDCKGLTDIIFDEPSELAEFGIRAFANSGVTTATMPTIGKGNTRISWLRKIWVGATFQLAPDKENIIDPPIVFFRGGTEIRPEDVYYYFFKLEGTKIDQVSLSLGKRPPEGGTIYSFPKPNKRLDTYDIDSKINLSAVPNEGYRFVKWVIDGKTITDYINTIVMDADKTATAYFAKQVKLTVLFPDRGQVKVAPETNAEMGTYDLDTNVRLTFLPTDGWGLDSWNIQGSDLTKSTDNPLYIVMDEDKNVSLTLKEQIYLTLEIEGGGNVKDFQVGKNPVDKSKSVELKGIANSGYEFNRWEITVSGQQSTIESSNPYTVTTAGVDLAVKAIFTTTHLTNQTTLTVDVVGKGTLSHSRGRIRQERNSLINLVATPAEGYRFDKWMLGREAIAESSYSFQIDKDTSATAYFVEQKTLTLKQEPAIGAILLPNTDLGTAFDIGSEITLGVSDIPSGYSFDRWTFGNKSYAEPATTIKLNTNTIAVAYFLETYTLTVLVHNNEGGRATPATQVAVEQKDSWHGIEMTATPDEGYRFEKWMIGGKSNTKNPYNIKLQGNTTATAYFIKLAKLKFSIVGSGTVSGAENDKYYYINEIIELRATPMEGYRFVKWLFEGGNEESTYSPLTLELTSDTEVTAYFAKQVRLNLLSVGHGTINGGNDGQDYDFNSEIGLTAEASEGFRFDRWVFSGKSELNQVSKDYPLNFKITQDTTVTAHFVVRTKEKVILTLLTIGSGIVVGPKNGSEHYLSSMVSLSAAPHLGYEFEKWVVTDSKPEAETVETNKYLTKILKNDATVTAYFVPKKNNKAKLTLSIVGYGTISGADNGAEFDINSEIKLVANPNYGYLLKKLGLSGKAGAEQESLEQPLRLTMTKDTTVTAYFVEIEKVELTLAVVSSGSIVGASSGDKFYKGSAVSLTAEPKPGYNFDKWELDGQPMVSTDPRLTLVLTKDTKVTAYFFPLDDILNLSQIKVFPIPVRYTLTVEATEIESIRLLSLVGVVVKELKGINTNRVQLDISDLSASAYFLEITQEDDAITLKKIIKE